MKANCNTTHKAGFSLVYYKCRYMCVCNYTSLLDTLGLCIKILHNVVLAYFYKLLLKATPIKVPV